jgi:DNA repair protein RadD
MITLRDYQRSAVDASIHYIHSAEKRPGAIIAPTAAGKSWIIAAIAKEHKNPILVLQPSIELLKQNFEKFEQLGGEASIYSAGAGSKEIGHVTYATLGSIKKDALKFKNAGVDLIIIDECHMGVKPDKGSMFRNFVDILSPKKSIGLTATPFRLKNNMMGSRLVMLNRMRPGYFRHFIHVTQISEMIDRGYWTKSVDESWIQDESSLVLNTTGSDYTEESIKAYAEVNGINNKIYMRLIEAVEQGRKSILVFTDSVESCRTFVEFLRANTNITCDFLTSDTKKSVRGKAIEDFKSGKTTVMFNFGILGTGFDYPGLDGVIMGRPTNSLAIFYQIYGRGARIFEGKKDFLFADYGNNFKRMAHPREIVIENYPGHGWAVFCGEKLVTGVYLSEEMTITKSDLDAEAEEVTSDLFFKFGKHEGKMVVDVAKKNPDYISWLGCQPWLDSTFKSKMLNILKKIQINELKGGVKIGRSQF